MSVQMGVIVPIFVLVGVDEGVNGGATVEVAEGEAEGGTPVPVGVCDGWRVAVTVEGKVGVMVGCCGLYPFRATPNTTITDIRKQRAGMR